MADGASKSYQHQVFCDHFSSLFRGIKENLDKVGPELEAAELLTPGAQEVWKDGSHSQNKKTVAILNAIEEKLMGNLDFFWRLVSVLRSLPALTHLASELESSSWQTSKGATLTQEQCTGESESTNMFLSPIQQGDLQHHSGELVLPNLPENNILATAKKFPSVAEPSFGTAVSLSEPGNFTELQLEIAGTQSRENAERRTVLQRVSLRQRHGICSEETDEESMRLKSLERAVGKLVSVYVQEEKAKLEADFEEKCHAECKQELDAMSDYYKKLEEELKLADSAHAAEIKYLKRTHEEEKKDLIRTQQLQAKAKDIELEQKENELKALRDKYEKKLEEVQEMEARLKAYEKKLEDNETMKAQLKAMKDEVKEMAKKVQAKEEGLRKWKSLEEVKNKMTTCREIGELISQWFEGNRDEAIKKQIEGKIQDIKCKRRGSKTL